MKIDNQYELSGGYMVKKKDGQLIDIKQADGPNELLAKIIESYKLDDGKLDYVTLEEEE